MTRFIRGTTEVCLKHFSTTFAEAITADRCVIRRTICDLIGISYDAGYQWFSKQILPIGVNLLKLQHLLEAAGYVVTECEQLIPEQRDLADQLAFGLVTVKSASQYASVTVDTVLRWSLGKSRPTDKMLTILDAFLTSQRRNAEENGKHWRDVIKSFDFAQAAHEPVVKPVSAIVESPALRNATNSDHKETIEVLSHLILAAIPLAKRVESDDFSPSDRRRLRELTGDGRSNGVFDLTNLLTRLCGERARNDLSHKPEERGIS